MTATSTGPGDAVSLGARAEPLLLGTTVSGGVIAAGAGHTADIASLVLTILGTALVYWAAHLHAVTLANEIESGTSVRVAFAAAVGQTWRIPAASILPIGVLGVAALLGADLQTAAWAAVVVTAVLLGAYGYVAGDRAGFGWRGRAASALGGVAVGMLIVLLKGSLH